MRAIVVNVQSREKRFALVSEGQIEKLYIDQNERKSLVGNIYIGIVEKVLPGMNAAFIDFGEEKRAFLSKEKLISYVLDENVHKQEKSISSYIHQGEKVMIQIEKDATGTKGPRVTGIIEISGQHLIYMPFGKYVAVSKKITEKSVDEWLRHFVYEMKTGEEGCIVRTSAATVSVDQLTIEWEQLRERFHTLQQQAQAVKKGLLFRVDHFMKELINELERQTDVEVMVDDLSFKKELEAYTSNDITFHQGKTSIFREYDLESSIDKAIRKMVWLDHGSFLIVEEGEAMTVIDVNSGKFKGKHSREATVFQVNELAAKEVVKQIRVRDLAGIILIDFIDMKNQHERKAILSIMEDGLKSDDRFSRIIGFTELNLLQIVRKKTKNSLLESVTTKCPTCEGSGRVLSAETMAFRLERELWDYRYSEYTTAVIAMTPDVKLTFCGDNDEHLNRVSEQSGLQLIIEEMAHAHPMYEVKRMTL